MQKQSFLKTALRKFGVEIKKSAFGLVLEEDLKSLDQKRPFRTIFDIGANEGQTAAHLSELFPAARIYSCEPSSRTFEKMKTRVQGIPNVTPIRTAVGSNEGTVKFKITGASVNSSILDYHKPTGGDIICDEEEVPLRTVAGICAEHKIDKIDLLKIDTQGYDMQVMMGTEAMLKAHKVGVVLTEVLMVQMYEGQAWFHDICTYMHSVGFRFCALHGINREDDPFIHWADVVFVDPEYRG
jgi:FkbM family methyltransferase